MRVASPWLGVLCWLWPCSATSMIRLCPSLLGHVIRMTQCACFVAQVSTRCRVQTCMLGFAASSNRAQEMAWAVVSNPAAKKMPALAARVC